MFSPAHSVASTSYDDHHNNSIDTTRFQNQVINRQGALSPQQTAHAELNDTIVDSFATTSAASAATSLLQQPISNTTNTNNLQLVGMSPSTSATNSALNFNIISSAGAGLLPPQSQTLPPSHFSNLSTTLQIGVNQSNHLPYTHSTAQLIPPTIGAVIPVQVPSLPPPSSAATNAGAVTTLTQTTGSGQVNANLPNQMPLMPNTSTPSPTASLGLISSTTSPQHSSSITPSPRSSTPTQSQTQLQHHTTTAQLSPQIHAPTTPPSALITATPTPPPISNTTLGPPPPLNIHAVQEAKEKLKQEKKEKHATKKLMKELAVCKTVLSEMEV